MVGYYDPVLVLVSVLVAIFASYTALNLAERVSRSEGAVARRWVAGGAFAMGTGIWSMHFLGMLAFRLPIPMGYDLGITLLSWVLPIAVSAVALWQLGGRVPTARSLAVSAITLALGIIAMHYVGMAAMRMDPAIDYDARWVAASVLIAMAASVTALWLGFKLRAAELTAAWRRRALAATVMGFAIVGMHYTAMQAASFPAGSVCRAATDSFSLTGLAALVVFGTLGILAVTLLTTIYDARMGARDAFLVAAEEAARERQRLLDSERALRAEAERLSSVKDDFLTTLSHELRTPLNAIVGWAQVLQLKSDPATLKTGLETIDGNARLQARLIDDLLDMSRIVSGRLHLELERLDPAVLALSAADAARPMAVAKAITLHCQTEPVRGQLMGDATRLQQVLSNLLSNAIKFTGTGGRVLLTVREADQRHVQFIVDDNGIGVERELLEKIFERFRQGDASTTRRHGGLGLGLAIVRELVLLHGGRAEAQSEGSNRGARFVVQLPLIQAPEAAAPVRPTGADPALRPGQGMRVLVVDDDADGRAVLARMLELLGAAVGVAEGADEALARIRQDRFDVVLSDIGMPGKDGFAFVRELRALPERYAAAMPAIAVSAFTRPEDAARAVGAGFDGHLPKPVQLDALCERLSRLARQEGET